MPKNSLHLGSTAYLSSGTTSQLFVEDVALSSIAKEVGTPCYFYSTKTIKDNYLKFDKALRDVPHEISFATKANSSIAVLKLLVELGAHFDTVSAGEILRAYYAGAKPENIVFSGVGKTINEIEVALTLGISSIHAESISEVKRIAEVAKTLGKVAPISVRVNPDIDPHTLDRISTGKKETKFGVALSDVLDLYDFIAQNPYLKAHGISAHIGSMITEECHYDKLLDVLIKLVKEIENHGITLTHIDLGGGYGVPYKEDQVELDVTHLFSRITQVLKEKLPGKTLVIEPGRSIVATSGGLLTQIQYIKEKKGSNSAFVVCDASMAELMRPTLYDAYHDALEVNLDKATAPINSTVVGSICETSDWLAKDRLLRVKEGDYLALMTAGAYGSSMANNYNTHMLPAEVLVSGNSYKIIKKRQNLKSLLANEVSGAIDIDDPLFTKLTNLI